MQYSWIKSGLKKVFKLLTMCTAERFIFIFLVLDKICFADQNNYAYSGE